MKRLGYILIVSLLFIDTGCSTVRVQSAAAASTTEGSIKLHRTAWGLWNSTYVVPHDSCSEERLQAVRVKSNFWQTFVTIVTIGIYCPVTVYWNCSTPCLRRPQREEN